MDGTGFCESNAQTLVQIPFGQVHLEDGQQAEGYAPRGKAHRHCNGYRARGGRIGQVGERAAALAVALKEPRISGVGPGFDHRDPLDQLVEGGSVRARSLERQLESDRSKLFGEL